jgi:glycosyltransferase involved in cell wall biosynthesis
MRICLIHSEPERLPRIQLEHQSLKKAGYDAYILSPRLRPRFRPRLVSAGLRYGGLMIQGFFERPDVYHVENIPDVLGLIPIMKRKGAWFFPMTKSAKVVYDVRSPWAEELRAFGHNSMMVQIAERIERYVTRNADVVVVVNKVLEMRAKEWGAKKVYVVPNYPPVDFRPTMSPIFKRQQGLSDKRVVLFVGKFSPVECTFEMVRTMADLLKQEKDMVLVMVGDGPERSNIESFVKLQGISDKVLITGWIPHDLVPNWISIADVCVLPRREDAPSAKFYSPHSVRKVGEYLALGKPVIATPVGEFARSDLHIKTAPLKDFPIEIRKVLGNRVTVDRPKDFTWEKSERTLLEAYAELERSLA